MNPMKYVLLAIVFIGVCLDAVAMGLEVHPNLRSSLSVLLKELNIFSMVLFCLEFAMRVIMHPSRWCNAQNICNFVLLFLSTISVACTTFWLCRIFRVIRVLRLTFCIPGLKYLVLILYQGVKAARYVVITIFFVTFFFAIAGIEFFRNRDPEIWGSLQAGLSSVFSIITLAEWVDHYDRLDRLGATYHTYFFLFIIIIGNFMFMGMFMGMVMQTSKHMKMEKLEEKEQKKKMKEPKEVDHQLLQVTPEYFRQLIQKYEQCDDEFVQVTERRATLMWIDLYMRLLKRQTEKLMKLKQVSDQVLCIQKELLEIDLQEKRDLEMFSKLRAVGAVGYTAAKFGWKQKRQR